MPSNFNLNCIPPLNTNYINAHNDNLFLHAQVKDGNNKDQDLMVLPDGGNRAKCILRYDIYQKLFPNQPLKPVDDVITTAKQQDRIEIVGTPEKKIDFILANGRFKYSTRPLVVKNLTLPCLFSAFDLQRMSAKIDYGSSKMLLGKGEIPAKLMAFPKKLETEVCTVYKEVIRPQTEAIIPVKILEAIGETHVLIQPNEILETEYELIGAPSVNTMDQSGIGHMRIVNMSDHPVHLKPGTVIGTACKADLHLNQIDKEVTKPKSKTDFIKKVQDDLKLDENNYLSKGQKKQLLELLYAFQDVISQGPSDIGGVTEIQCSIPTEEGKTVKAACRPLPPHLKKNLKEQLDAWVSKGVVEKASSACPFSSPLVPVKKKNGQIRWAVDYRALNSISRKDHRPIPNVFEKLSSLKAGSRKPLRFYGALDLVDAFLNIPIVEEDRDKTAIITPFGLYRFLRMPFGLHGAPQAFAELIRLLEDRIGESTELAEQILIYFDDCLLCGSTWEEFLLLLEVFLTQLRKIHLKINIKKCQLGLPSIKWLDMNYPTKVSNLLRNLRVPSKIGLPQLTSLN